MSLAETANSEVPSFRKSVIYPVIATLLNLLDTGLNTLSTIKVIDGSQTWVEILRMLGKTPVALLITLLVAIMLLKVNALKNRLKNFATAP